MFCLFSLQFSKPFHTMVSLTAGLAWVYRSSANNETDFPIVVLTEDDLEWIAELHANVSYDMGEPGAAFVLLPLGDPNSWQVGSGEGEDL